MYSGDVNNIITRQFGIAEGDFPKLDLPNHNRYTICNLRGGVGKTTLSFNLSYLADDVLAVDTCPQGNLSFLLDKEYYVNSATSAKDLVLPYLIPGLGKATRVASFVGATNEFFSDKKAYYIPSSAELYLLPSQLTSAIYQTNSLQNGQRKAAVRSILFSLKNEIDRELREIGDVSKCLIDTSPFFAGATQLAWYATDALVVPVNTDSRSIKSLELLINTLTSPQSEFRRYLEDEPHTPKIQMVVLTHCGWSTAKSAKNEPNNTTILYLKKVMDILSRNRGLLTTGNPLNHLLLLDNFLGSGRISSDLAKPIELLRPSESHTVDRVKVTVNSSVVKCQNQLKFIDSLLW